nr:MAG TPA: hypothetical protein [Caudoviricetes sp.]DAU65425.1 MAG TPA: hypothetical protein [Caudoviricetes sp.]
MPNVVVKPFSTFWASGWFDSIRHHELNSDKHYSHAH